MSRFRAYGTCYAVFLDEDGEASERCFRWDVLAPDDDGPPLLRFWRMGEVTPFLERSCDGPAAELVRDMMIAFQDFPVIQR